MRDFGSIVNEKKIPWVRHWIAATYEFSQDFRKENGEIDFEALGREEYEFRKALYTGELSLNKRAEYLWNEAMNIHSVKSENGKKGGRPRKDDNGAVAEVAPKVVDEYSHRTAAASLAYSGQNGLVRLSDDEYNILLQKIGNKRKADKLIDDLDYALAEGKTFKQPHLHVLSHWQSYRDDKAEERKADQEAKAVAKNTMSFQEIEGQRQVEQLRKYGLIK